MSDYLIEVFENTKFNTSNELINKLREFNDSQVAIKEYYNLELVAKVDKCLVGGLIGNINYNWLFISTLWVCEEYRGKGLGRKLLEMIEKMAVEKKCMGVHLDTYSFQGPDFYQKFGYKIIGKIENHPIGHCRYYLKKLLC